MGGRGLGRSGGSEKLSIDFLCNGCTEALPSSLAFFIQINSKDIYKIPSAGDIVWLHYKKRIILHLVWNGARVVGGRGGGGYK